MAKKNSEVLIVTVKNGFSLNNDIKHEEWHENYCYSDQTYGSNIYGIGFGFAAKSLNLNN
jgi:hypothetical protein